MPIRKSSFPLAVIGEISLSGCKLYKMTHDESLRNWVFFRVVLNFYQQLIVPFVPVNQSILDGLLIPSLSYISMFDFHLCTGNFAPSRISVSSDLRVSYSKRSLHVFIHVLSHNAWMVLPSCAGCWSRWCITAPGFCPRWVAPGGCSRHLRQSGPFRPALKKYQICDEKTSNDLFFFA